ncbi:alpha/beta hydrolase fold protein [Enhygromyxa salina]|uniref:Alpha/beta hydrolase fold protein n=2 Tax=Enhygromyxa salina TaxID=215803 RepID=A0A2S9Y3D2_9BACT|nr:alpha/beta hydrolase fold protein [Enhygromyxa salina]
MQDGGGASESSEGAESTTQPGDTETETGTRASEDGDGDGDGDGDSDGDGDGDRVIVEVEQLSYGDDASQTLDLYTPERPAQTSLPTLVLAHGGLWQAGDKSALAGLCTAIVTSSAGAQACASINYRLSQALGGECSGTGLDTYTEQVRDLAAAVTALQNQAAQRGLDPARFYVGGHSAGGHMAHELNLRWPDFEGGCARPGTCPPAIGAIGFEGIYDIAAWDSYDANFWAGQFACATRKAFGAPPSAPDGCTDQTYARPCWDVGSPRYLADHLDDLSLAAAGDALIIHSPGDDWVDVAEATTFGIALDAAAPERSVITSVDGTCASGQHNDVLGDPALASCIVNFVASAGASI